MGCATNLAAAGDELLRPAVTTLVPHGSLASGQLRQPAATFGVSAEAHAGAEPIGEPGFVDFVGGDGEHGGLGSSTSGGSGSQTPPFRSMKTNGGRSR
jgi:hypothetical protein